MMPLLEDFLAPHLPSYALVARANAVFERLNPYQGMGFSNHCHRLFMFVTLLCNHEGILIDPNMAYAIAMFHDLGLVCKNIQGNHYLQRSWLLFEQETQGCDWGDTPPRVVSECVLYNHLLVTNRQLSPQAEMFRRAVQIEHTHGWLRFGLNKQTVKQILKLYPRDNLTHVLIDFAWRVFRREPRTLINGIFFSK